VVEFPLRFAALLFYLDCAPGRGNYLQLAKTGIRETRVRGFPGPALCGAIGFFEIWGTRPKSNRRSFDSAEKRLAQEDNLLYVIGKS